VTSWIDDAWSKITVSCIKNTWRSIGHFVPGELGDTTITQESEDVASFTIPVSGSVSHDDDGGETVETRTREWNVNMKKRQKTSHSFVVGAIFGPICWTLRMKSLSF
jgi:hypothetical protein